MLKQIAQRISQEGGQAYLVGGAVRDQILGLKPKDLDVEVYGLSAKRLAEILSEFGEVKAVGESFGVLKMGEFDFSLPRRENKVGRGHKGFQVELDPTMTPFEAAKRRDFTFNALLQDVATGKMIDYFGGEVDLICGILEATSPHFIEDPLRVLRGMQFAARFNLEVELGTADMCVLLKEEYKDLSIKRVWEEWEKWALKGVKPSIGLEFLREVDWVYLYPEISSLISTPQSKRWHPEGDAWDHTLQAVDKTVELCEREIEANRLVMVFAALCHDFGKPLVTEWDGEKYISHGHDKAGEEPTISFLTSIGAPQWLIEKVVPLVTNHMIRRRNIRSYRAVRRLAERLQPASLQELMWIVEIDGASRHPAPPFRSHSIDIILTLAEEAKCKESPVPDILMGRHLIELGMIPGPQFGVILREAREVQINGGFTDLSEALEWARRIQCH